MRTFILLVLAQLLPLAVVAEEIHLAVASNFSLPARELCKQFAEDTGHHVIVSSGSSGKLYAQILNGAPYDLFLSADSAIPQKLEQQGISTAGERFSYARGRLALYRAHDGLDLSDVPALLAGDSYRRLAIANPRTAPYGAAAMQVLKALGLETRLRSRLVQGENISQTWQFVQSGNAELGLVSGSQVIGTDSADYWLVPEHFHEPLIQQGVPLRQAERRAPVRALIGYLQSAPVRKLLQEKYGYGSLSP